MTKELKQLKKVRQQFVKVGWTFMLPKIDEAIKKMTK